MRSCATTSSDVPIVNLILAGAGEPLLRMQKRMSCAAASLGIRLDIEIRKDSEALGILYSQTPAVLHDGKVIVSSLHRTEEIEVWLKNLV